MSDGTSTSENGGGREPRELAHNSGSSSTSTAPAPRFGTPRLGSGALWVALDVRHRTVALDLLPPGTARRVSDGTSTSENGGGRESSLTTPAAQARPQHRLRGLGRPGSAPGPCGSHLTCGIAPSRPYVGRGTRCQTACQRARSAEAERARSRFRQFVHVHSTDPEAWDAQARLRGLVGRT